PGDNDVIDSLQYVVPSKKTGATPYQNLSKGLTPNFNKNGQVIFVDVKEVLAPQAKSLEESKGLVTADYQSYLEKNWIEELRKKYPVQVNEPVLNTIIKN